MTANMETLLERIGDIEKLQLNSEVWKDIVKIVESCMLPGLIKPYDEYNEPLEKGYRPFFNAVGHDLEKLDKILKTIEPKIVENSLNYDFIASMLLLLEEMRADDFWTNVGYTKYCKFVFDWLQKNTHINLMYYTKCNLSSSEHFDAVFQICLKKLYLKLTKDKWKLYPAEIYCYRSIANNWIENHRFNCPLPLIFPGTLIQIDDYRIYNKVEGLKCCSSILKNLDWNKHDGTGYEVAVYETLTKYLQYREECILDETLDCLVSILPYFKSETLAGQWSKCDDILDNMLDGVYMESDLKRKAIYFKYLPTVITLAGICAIRWKIKLFKVIIDNLEICLNNTLDNRIVLQCLQCLKNWIRVGWPVFEFPADSKIILALFKVIVVLCEEPFNKSNVFMAAVEDVLFPVLSLYNTQQRLELFDSHELETDTFSQAFLTKWTDIKNKAMLVKSDFTHHQETS